MPGGDSPRKRALPGWVRAVIAAQAAVLLVLGLALFVAPLATAPLWPWSLTALTGRAFGAWFLGLGLAAAQMTWENDWQRIVPGSAGFAVFGVLELVVLARYPRAVDWAGPRVWLYLIFLLGLLAVGGYGWYAGRRAKA